MARSKIPVLLLVFLSVSLTTLAQDKGQKPAQPPPAPAAALLPSPQPPSTGDSTELEVITAPRAVYPKAAVDAQTQGQVWLGLLISETGDVESTEIISGNPILAKAAEEAMRKWKFKPYIRNGKPAKVKTKMPYDFELGGNKIVILTPGDTAGAALSNPSTELASSSEGPLDSTQDGIPKVVRVSRGVMEGLIVHRVDLVYPLEAKRNHITGDVILQARIGKDGRIHELKALSGHPALVEASMGAVQQWRYRPCTFKGEPVEVETTIKLQFHM